MQMLVMIIVLIGINKHIINFIYINIKKQHK